MSIKCKSASNLGRESTLATIGHNKTTMVERVQVSSLHQDPKDARRVCARDIERAVGIVAKLGDKMPPVLVGDNHVVIAGWPTVEAARKLGIEYLPAVRMEGLSPSRQLVVSTAINRLWELGDWDERALGKLVLEFEQTVPDFEIIDIGWSTTEGDLLIGADKIDEEADVMPAMAEHAVSQPGDIFMLGDHRIGCLDATNLDAYQQVMTGHEAAMLSADPPYGIPINGFVAKAGKHREFVEASGEKSDPELLTFFRDFLIGSHSVVRPGGLVYLYIDWRSQLLLQQAAEKLFGKLVNLCVWVKDRAGMGSFYRSRHELVLIYRKPGGKHRNNIELGRHGRDRSNVWEYPGATSTRSSREGDLLAHHPTPKNVGMVMDSILDCTARGARVLDPFLGSGTTLIAAERTGRICHGMDLDPLYVDLAIRRWQAWTGKQAVNADTGETFDDMAAPRLEGGGL